MGDIQIKNKEEIIHHEAIEIQKVFHQPHKTFWEETEAIKIHLKSRFEELGLLRNTDHSQSVDLKDGFVIIQNKTTGQFIGLDMTGGGYPFDTTAMNAHIFQSEEAARDYHDTIKPKDVWCFCEFHVGYNIHIKKPISILLNESNIEEWKEKINQLMKHYDSNIGSSVDDSEWLDSFKGETPESAAHSLMYDAKT